MTNPNPVTTRFTKQNAKEMGRKGGQARTNRKRLAAKIRGRAKTDPLMGLLMQIAKTDDPKLAFEYYARVLSEQEELINKTKNKYTQFYMRDKFLSKLFDIHKLKFGNIQKNVNVDMKTAFDQMCEEAEKWKNEQEITC